MDSSYVGFPPLPDKVSFLEALLYAPPEVRWRPVREIYRIGNADERWALIKALQSQLFETTDFRIKHRLTLALRALHHPLQRQDYVLVKGKGAFKRSELDVSSGPTANFETRFAENSFLPIVDFHIHPKSPDLKFFADLREAGVTHGVILATDTDPADVDRPEIREKLRRDYSKAVQSQIIPFEKMLSQIRASLHSASHVVNQDVADWVADYPEILFGFGSVNLSKSKEYVEKTLDEIQRLKLKGIKLLPYSQFFNPAENDNMELLFQYCAATRSVILSHCGCGAGPFELPELSQDSHPALWEPLLKKHPEVVVVFAHFGAYSSFIPGIWLYEVLQLGKKYKNVYADLAAVDWILDRDMVIKEIRKTIGFNRVLFATDYPLPATAGVSLAYLVSALRANTLLTEKEKRKVLGENAARLLGIG